MKKNKKEKKIKDKKEIKENDVPVLKNPAESKFGKVVIWFLLILMASGGLGGIIYAIVKVLI